jgi:hypothetical protein
MFSVHRIWRVLAGSVELTVYDLPGSEVSVLVDERMVAGVTR